MDKVKKVRIKKLDETFSNYIPIGAEADKIDTAEKGVSLQAKIDQFNQVSQEVKQARGSKENLDARLDGIEKREEDLQNFYSQNFGRSPGTIAEGDHKHPELALQIDDLKKKLNYTKNADYKSQELYKNVSPAVRYWQSTSGLVVSNTIINQGRIEFDAFRAEHGVAATGLDYLMPMLVAGSNLAITGIVETPETNLLIKVKYPTGWEFERIDLKDNYFKTITIKEGLLDFQISVESAKAGMRHCAASNINLLLQNKFEIKNNLDIPTRNYSIWSWSLDELIDYKNTMTFLKNLKINRIYQSVNLNLATYEQLRAFTGLLQTNDISVNWVTGDPLWALESYHEVALDAIRRVNDYNKSANEGFERIEVIQFDIEFYVLPEYKKDPKQVILQYQRLLSKMKKECAKYQIGLSMCLPHWLDSIEYDNDDFGKGNLYDFVSRYSNSTIIMSYHRKYYLPFSKAEIEMNKKNGKRLGIGLETKEVNPDIGIGPDITFAEDPISNLYIAFETLFTYEKVLGIDDKYELAIHDLKSFKQYVLKNQLEIKSLVGTGPLKSPHDLEIQANEDFQENGRLILASGNNKMEIVSNSAEQNLEGLTYNGHKIYHEGFLPASDYTKATNKPSINGNILQGDLTTKDLGISSKTSDLENDSHFISGPKIKRIEIVDMLPDVEEEDVLYLLGGTLPPVPPVPVKKNLYYQGQDNLYTSSGDHKYTFNTYKSTVVYIDSAGTSFSRDKEKHTLDFAVRFKENTAYKIIIGDTTGTVNFEPDGPSFALKLRQTDTNEEIFSGDVTYPFGQSEFTFINKTLKGLVECRFCCYLFGGATYNKTRFTISMYEEDI